MLRAGASFEAYYCLPVDSCVRKQNNELQFVLLYFIFYFFILIILHFSIFRTMGLGLEVIGHTVTSVTSDGMVTTLITGLERKE